MEKSHVIQGTYQIIREIGSGSGGTVFLAYHIRLQKNVVLKQIKANAKKLLNNRTETDILKNLHHLYLPQVFDFVEDIDESGNEVIYTVMDFIPGKSFDELLREGKTFTSTQVVKYMKQLCEAVDYLHSQVPPIIHGDIKPANVMLTPEDNICVIDFNISGFSDSMEILGFTRGYAAPEQCMAARANLKRKKAEAFAVPDTKKREEAYDVIDGDRTVVDNATDMDDRTVIDNEIGIRSNTASTTSGFGQVIMIDRRADIYSIGATMYPLLTGRKPDPNYEKSISIADSGIQISEGLAFIIDKALQLKPGDRFQSAGEMLQVMNALGKKDKRYKRLLKKQLAAIVFFIILAASFTVVSYMGFRQMKVEKANKYYNTSLKLYEEKAYDEDLEYILKVALKDESLYDKGMLGNLYYLAAECSFESDQYEAAADFYGTSLIYNTNSQEAYCNYAISLAKLNKTEEALKVINKAIDRGVNADQIYLMKGELSAAQGDIEEAANNFASCIEVTEDTYVLARAYIMFSDLYSATEDYKVNSGYISANIQLLNAAKNEVSEEYLPIILQRLTDAYCISAELTQDSSYNVLAIETLNETISMGWGTFDVYINLALLYENVGMYDESYSTLNTLLKQYGDNYAVYKRLAFLEIDIQAEQDSDQRDYSSFLEYYEKAGQLFAVSGKQIDQDMEMQLLENTYDTLVSGGWMN